MGAPRGSRRSRTTQAATQDTVTLAEVLIASSTDGLVAIDDTSQIIYFNQAAGKIFGVEPEQALGQNLEEILKPDFIGHQQYVRDYFRGLGRGVVDQIPVETEIRHSSGQMIPVEISLASARLHDRPLVLASLRNIARRQEADRRNRLLTEQLMQAQKMEAIGTLAAGIAHDFNNMLGAIMGYTSVMLHEIEHRERHYQDLNQIQNIVYRAKKLTENLLTASRRAEFNSETISLTSVVSQVVELLRHTVDKNIVIRTRLAKDLYVDGDRPQLEQTLMNICLNSRDAMPDGGTITIQSAPSCLDEPAAQALGLTPGPYVQVTIKDDGFGMDGATLTRAFDPFFSTKQDGEGSGLGLSLVFAVVKNHGGQVKIQSELGQGTAVSLYLPASDEKPAREDRPAQKSKQAPGRGETILLVDDERHLREMAKRLLEGLGYRVFLAQSGEQAVEIYREHRQQIQLVILDVVMAGWSGLRTLEHLQEINQEVKILVSSGYNQNGAPKELLGKRVCGFLQKPYGIEEINKAIQSALC